MCEFNKNMHYYLCNSKKSCTFVANFIQIETINLSLAMNTLYQTMERMLAQVSTTTRRYLHDQIEWNARLIAISGQRGVGKTTMLLQRIKQNHQPNEALYVLADDFYFAQHRLFELALQFYQQGGRYLYIDEIHKYRGWSNEIKNIYDQIPQLNVIYTGSSILDLERGDADLSRRKLGYKLHGLSFREYVNMSKGLSLPAYSLEDIVSGKVEFPMNNYRPLQLFAEYMQKGYYPFFSEPGYAERLKGALKLTMEVDIPMYAEMNVGSAQKLRKLLYVLAQSVPFKPNYAKLERDLDISRNTLPQYMDYLDKAGLINVLRENTHGIKLLEKIDKVYLNNPNIAEVLSETSTDIGNMRETIFLSWLRVGYHVTSSSIADFEIDGKTFEVGGKNKGKRQIADAEQGYVVKDNIEYAYHNEIPLWHFGFVY